MNRLKNSFIVFEHATRYVAEKKQLSQYAIKQTYCVQTSNRLIGFSLPHFFLDMIKKSKLLRTIDPTMKLFGLFGFPNIFIPKKPNRMEKFRIVFAILKFIIALGFLSGFICDSFGQIETLYEKNISIHIINHVGNSLPAIVSLVQSAVMLSKFNNILKKFEEVDEIFLNFLHLEINYEWVRLVIFIRGEQKFLKTG